MARRKKIARRKKTNVSVSFQQRQLKEEDIVQITGSPIRCASIKPSCKKSPGPLKKYDSVSTSETTKHNRLSKYDRLSRRDYVENNNGLHCDYGEVKRLYSPFNRFSTNKGIRSPKTMSYQSQYSHIGLSPREKSYIINSLQTKTSKYVKLKALAANAIESNKIFTIYGSCSVVRKALLERGWIEKIPPNRMNLSKIRNGSFADKHDVHNELERLLLSNLVEKHPPNFVWGAKDDHNDTTIDMNSYNMAITNKLRVDATWTTKQGLCTSMKQKYWYYIENVADVTGPRTYNSYESGEIEGFVKDFQITACTSLLKWVLSMVANERPIFNETGTVQLNVIVFALNRCKEYLLRKQNKDIDRGLNTASNGQWITFLKKYYSIIAKDDVFTLDEEGRMPLYLIYAKFLLKEIHKYRPQLSCEGCHNIWIIKPANCSRGRGIRMASKLAVITNLITKANAKYVIQKYIEEPLLVHETKFDIRQYYLITSTYPLVIWMYKDCYLKFSSQKYNLKNYHESIHLTNNAVQKRYKNCQKRHSDLPQHNMWSLDDYKEYLIKIGKEKVWDTIIYPGMKKCVVGVMLSCQDSLSVSRNRFELYGCDFILDKAYKPWLIEINSCPDLKPTTQVTAKICPAVISDIIKVVIDRPKNSSCSTGKFECIYRQPAAMPRCGGVTDLVIRGYSLSPDYFYKGKLQITETYENADIGEETDIMFILNKLKHDYETNAIVELDQSEPVEDVTIGSNTKSENELSIAAATVNAQIDDLLDRIQSENSSTCTSAPSTSAGQQGAVSPALSASITHYSTKSEPDINSLLPKTESHSNSADALIKSQNCDLSDLSDEPFECVGPCTCNALKRSVANQSYENYYKTYNKINLPIRRNMIEATTKMVSFIDKEEKEHYYKEVR